MMFKILDEVCTPIRSTRYSAYIDLFSREDVVIGAGETKVIPLGIKLDVTKIGLKLADIGQDNSTQLIEKLNQFKELHYLEVALRSSLAVKGLIIPNGIGIIDLDYPDEIGLIVHNPIIDENFNDIVGALGGNRDAFVESKIIIHKGDKVAQCTIKEHKGYLMGYESDVIRDGGYGSTGDKR